MATDFTTLTTNKATDLAALPADRLATLKTNRAFYDGEHWQEGAAWVGPWPIVPEGATAAQAKAVHQMHVEIRRGQVTVNAIKECVDREATGTVGIEPRWSFTADGLDAPVPADATAEQRTALEAERQRVQARIDRANSLATSWWDRVGAHERLTELATKLLYGAAPDALASLRLYVPAAMLEDERGDNGATTGRKVLKVASVEDALAKIHLEVLDGDEGRVVEDPDTLAEIGIKPTQRGEERVAEVTYLDPASNRTVIQTIRATARPGTTLDLGGRLTMITVSRAAFVTEQVRQNQRALNFAAFVIRRNNETAGFLQDTILNAHIPGHYEGEGDKRRYVADPIERGPLALNAFRGFELKDGEGRTTGLTSPSIDHREPIDPTPSIKAKGEHYADILGACSQRHVLMSGDAVASGESRIQARGEHVKSLRLTQAPVQRAGRWMLETVLLFADALANGGNKTALLDGLRAIFSCYLDAGPVSSAERAENLSEMQEGALSRTTAIERNGVVDVDAELQRIDADRNGSLDAELKRAQIYAAWIGGGVGEAAAARRAGLTDAEIKLLTTAQTDVPPKVTQ